MSPTKTSEREALTERRGYVGAESMTAPHCRALLLLGAPGAGKTTQARALATVPGFHHFSSGDMLRVTPRGTKLGERVHRRLDRGELVPADVVIDVFKEHLHARAVLGMFQPAEQVLVLDGIPRDTAQAERMDHLCDVLGVVRLVAEHRVELARRIAGRREQERRSDDVHETLERRWYEYRDRTLPLIEHYPHERVRKVNALASPAVVLRDVLTAVADVIGS